MPFYQSPPRLGNQWTDDALLHEYLERRLPAEVLTEMRPTLHELGELAGGRLYEQQLRERHLEPTLQQWDAWGHRVDHIEVSPLWKEAAKLSARYGMVALAYEPRYAELSRVLQFASCYLFFPSTEVYSCPLAMTDGAARTLLDTRNQALIERAVPRLTSRDPDVMWTSGQWMTERTGGSDVGLTETVARPVGDGTFRLYGTKWFTSATTAQMALALARPEGNGPGGRGLALFYVEVKRPDGTYNGIQVNRLKDKLGTRKVPTAELLLEGCIATPVTGLSDGIRNIAPMLNVTRTWNAVMSAAGMRRAIALARDYATRRVQFGARLIEKPLHTDTLAGMQAEFEGAFLLAFRAAELLGRREAGIATEKDNQLLRLVTPIAKLTTARQAVAVASESLEACGGAGYVEDTGLPSLLRDAQVLPIWEGTTNVLSLDTLRALGADGAAGFGVLRGELAENLQKVRDPGLRPCVEAATAASERALGWLAQHADRPHELEAGARRFALTMGRALELSYLCSHAQWCIERSGPGAGVRAASAARRLARHGVDVLGSADLHDLSDAQALAAC